MKFKAQLTAMRIDLAGYREELDKTLRAEIAHGLMAWLDSVLNEIPSWSGASRATFVALAEKIGMHVPITTTPNARVMAGDRVGRGVVSGAASRLNLNDPPGHYTFEYHTDLPWLVWNEYHDANVEPDETKWPPPAKLLKPGPYEFQAKGAAAFRSATKNVSLPRVGPFIHGTKYKVG